MMDLVLAMLGLRCSQSSGGHSQNAVGNLGLLLGKDVMARVLI